MVKTTKTYSLLEVRFWSAFWVHMRPYLLFVSGVAGWCGLAIAPSNELFSMRSFWSGLSFFLAYGFGQALTDCFQTDTDKISAAYRPLSRGIVSSFSVGIVSVFGLIVLSGFLIFYNPVNGWLCLLSVFGLATYTYVKRHFWWLGPFYNAFIMALLPAMGYLIGTQGGADELISRKPIFLMLLTFFSYSTFVLIGYLKDITADQQTGYRTFPVIFGWRKTLWVGWIFLGLSFFFGWQLLGSDPWGYFLFCLGMAWAISGQVFGHMVEPKTETNATYPIVTTVRGFVLYHLAVMVTYQGNIWFALLIYLSFELVLRVRPMREQI